METEVQNYLIIIPISTLYFFHSIQIGSVIGLKSIRGLVDEIAHNPQPHFKCPIFNQYLKIFSYAALKPAHGNYFGPCYYCKNYRLIRKVATLQCTMIACNLWISREFIVFWLCPHAPLHCFTYANCRSCTPVRPLLMKQIHGLRYSCRNKS